MADEITRPELDAKLNAVEARMDTRLQGLVGTVNLMSEKVDNLARLTQSSIEANGSTRTQIIVAAVGVIVAVIGMGVAVLLGIGQLVPAVNQATISAFESGRTTGKAQSEASAKGELSTPSKPEAPAKP